MTVDILRIITRTLVYLLAIFAFCFLLPTSVYTLVGTGLDPSWQIALNMAFERQLIFGRDFLFTYGPLGFLSTRLPFASTKTWIFLNDLFLLPSVGFCMYQLARRIETVAEAMVLVFACIVTGGVIVYMDLSIVLLFLVLLFTMLYLDQKRIVYLVWAAPLGVLCFFVKLNMGLVAVCAVFFFAIVDAVRFQSFKRAVVTLGVPVILLGIGALVLPVDLLLYARGSLEIAAGYNESMFIAPTSYHPQLFQALLLLGILAFCFLLRVRFIFTHLDPFLRCGWVALFLFFLFKQSFVRADGHVFIFFQYCTFVTGALYLFAEPHFKGILRVPALLSIIFAFAQTSAQFSAGQVLSRGEGLGNYFSEMFSASAREAVVMPKADPQLPQSFINTIGNKPVDIIPWEIRRIYDAGMNYTPRPVMQSYSAYTPYLDGLNAAKYSSESGPQFVIFANHCVDRRYCFFDEAQTKNVLLTHFEVADRGDDMILLAKRPQPLASTVVPLKDGRINFGERLRFSSRERFLLLKLDVGASFLGRLRTLFYQPAELDIGFHFEDGSSQRFRALPQLLKTGVLINKFVTNISDAEAFFAGQSEKIRTVTSIDFTSGDTWAFKPRLKYELSELSLAPQSADSTTIGVQK